MSNVAQQKAERQQSREQKSDGKTYRIPVSTGIFPHYWQIKDALWLFLWYVDKTTKEIEAPDGSRVGKVLGGKPCRDQDAASAFRCHVQTVRGWRRRLAKHGYIKQKRTPLGYVILTRKSKKWLGKGVDKNVQSDGGGEVSNRLSQSEPNGSVRVSLSRTQSEPNPRSRSDSTGTIQEQDRKSSPLPVPPIGGKAVMFSKPEHDPVFQTIVEETGNPNQNPTPPVEEKAKENGQLRYWQQLMQEGDSYRKAASENALRVTEKPNRKPEPTIGLSYDPQTDAEHEQKRQRQKLNLERYLKAGGLTCSKNPIPEASASD